MADIIIPGPAGRIEARHFTQKKSNAPVALILHPHPLYGGSMHNKVTYVLYQTLLRYGFHVCRFNFRGIGKSSGTFDNGEGELSDAATVLDWMQTTHPDSNKFWLAGFSFGAWIAMQLLMRRPEVDGFISVAPPVNKFDFNFLAPCPVSGQIIQGDKDEIVNYESVEGLAEKLNQQKAIEVALSKIKGANHFFTDHLTDLNRAITHYLQKNVGPLG